MLTLKFAANLGINGKYVQYPLFCLLKCGTWPLQPVRSPARALELSINFSSVQLLSCVWLFATPWTAAHQAFLSIANSWRLLKLMSIESVMPSNHLILCHPLILPPSIFPIRVFSNELVFCIRQPNYWSFSFSISPPNEYSGLISFRMNWLDLLAVQGSSPAPQFKGINSLTLSLLYGPAVTFIHDYWRNHSFDCTNLCRQIDISAF